VHEWLPKKDAARTDVNTLDTPAKYELMGADENTQIIYEQGGRRGGGAIMVFTGVFLRD
jgi:hypothetical protein